MTLVSIIVPCYNSARFLAQTVDSVRRQSIADWELILVDDGSHDETGELITAWAKEDPRIRAIIQPNGGTSRARNHGFSKSDSSSPYLFFLDHDDCIEPLFLQKMCDYLEVHPEVGLLACQHERIDEAGTRLPGGGEDRWKPGLFLARKMRDAEIETPFATFFSRLARGPFAVFRRSVYEQTEEWETEFWPDEDSDMFCQMALLAKVHYLPDRLYLKRTVAGQGSGNVKAVWDSYGEFRNKWDHRIPRNPHEAALLREAKIFYYKRYRPTLSLLGVARAIRSLLRTGRVSDCRRQIAQNLTEAWRDFLAPVPGLVTANRDKVPAETLN